ncbi:MAG: Na+/H+ antiporter NhaC [Firmicutes bacterium]|nr:Na+/H+ antiporter NhaC [Bacillota bacterium]CDA91167.1 na+/H+ antiporter NhaC [Firmicutes bacterium CAG:238]
MSETKQPRMPKVWEALIPVAAIMVFMIVGTVVWGMDPHIPLVLACVVTAFVAAACGYKWDAIITGALDSVKSAVEALLIILCVGMLIGSWVWAGTMPAMVYYGLKFISPSVFLALGLVLTAIVGLATGSSWTASGTVGVALMGVAMGLGISAPLAAGMIIAGAYTGDKLSPLSDSTNVAAAAAGTPLYDHVGAMMTTTVPSFVISFVLYLIVGFVVIDTSGYDASLAQGIMDAIAENFYLSPWIMLPVLVVIFAAVKRIPAIPSLLLAAAVAAVIAIFAQGASVPDVLIGLQAGFSIETGNEYADSLLNRGGLDSMLWTISLIMFALAYGGMMEKCRFVESLMGGIVKRVKSTASLVAATIITGIICDVILTDQYLAIMIPSRMFRDEFDKRDLSRSFLSRTTEDGATLWSPMIPWNGCGAYQAATLGVHNFAFMPFAFVNLINPVLAVVITAFGIGVKYKEYDGLRGAELRAAKAKKKAELAAAKKEAK